MSERFIASAAVIIVAYIISTVLALPVRVFAVKLGVVDKPGGRKSHGRPVPRLGGLAIFGALILVVGGSLFGLPHLQSSRLAVIMYESLYALSSYTLISGKLLALFAGSLIITAIGILDDVRGANFSPYLKLLGQIAAAVILLPAGIYLDLLYQNQFLSMLFSVIWLVGITNSFNLLDNMDGLSSGIALICSCIFLILVMLKGEFFIALLLSAVIGSTLGFFQFNMRGRYFFMGDTGSLLLGYLLGAISLMARYVDATDTSIFPVVAPVIILGLPLFDTFSVIVIRLREGRPVLQGDQTHLSHRLVRMGMTTQQAVYFNFLMAFTIAANALLVINSRLLTSLIAVFQVAALVAMVSILMAVRTRANGNGDGQAEHSGSGLPVQDSADDRS